MPSALGHICQTLAANVFKLFNPPPRPKATSWTPGPNKRFVRTIDGYDIHCNLITPFDRPTSIDTYSATHDGANGILLASHGNSEDLRTFHSYAQMLADRLDMPVLVYDYPGYGFSSGDACTTDDNMFAACEAAVHFIVDTLRHRTEDIVIFGKSIGTVPSVQLATQSYMSQCSGLILVSPLASGARCLVTPKYSKYLSTNFMNSMDLVFGPSLHRIHDISCLLCVVHGTEDTIVPISNAHQLMEQCPAASYYPPLYVEAGHNDIESRHTDVFFKTLTHFVSTCREKQQKREARQARNYI